jgi:ABC-type Fe3+-siderophore transport system permease subunit
MLLYTDWIVHWPLWPETLPVGLVTAFLGAPIFFFILLRKARHA